MPSRFVDLLKSLGMPRMIYGTAWKKEKTARLGVDTAAQRVHYDQAGTGTGISDWFKLPNSTKREDLFVQTKFSPGQQSSEIDLPYDPLAPLYEQVQQSAQVSMKELNVDYIDSYLLHTLLPTMKEIMEVWSSFESLVQQKKVKFIGISNIYQPHILQMIYEQATIKPKIIQNRFYSETNYDREIRQFCDKNDIVYQSFWTLTANTQALQLYNPNSKDKTIADLYKFVMQENIVPLNGTSSLQHMKQDLDLLNSPPLDSAAQQRMKRILFGE